MDIKNVLAILGSDKPQPRLVTTMPPGFEFMVVPDKQSRTRGLSKEMKNAQATLRLHAGQSAVVKVCKNKATASSTAANMNKSPNWEGFVAVSRDVRVFATFIKTEE